MKKAAFIITLALLFVATASYAGTDPYRTGFVEGFLRELTDGNALIEEYDGTEHLLALDPGVRYAIDGIITGAVDFKPGIEVYARLAGRSVIQLEGYSGDNPGYIPPGGCVRYGSIRKIDRNQLTVRLDTGDVAAYYTTAATIALKKGVNVPLSTLYEGDRVKLYFDETASSIISRMEIEGDSIIINDIYRGELVLADRYERTVTLENVKVYKNGRWAELKGAMRLPYSDGASVYAGGEEISRENLKYYYGKTAYMAIKDHFGSGRIERLVLKSHYESVFSQKINRVNWFTGALELDNYKNIAFNDGTIIIKSGRLVDSYAINAGQDAFVVSDGSGASETAGLIYIYNEDIDNSNIGEHYLYAGRLDEILAGSLTLKDFYLLNQNSWESFRDDKTFYYSDDTYIYDNEDKRRITPEEFYAGYYAVDESSDYVRDKGLEDWYAYLYTDGDRVLCLSAQESMDSLLRQRITAGTVESLEENPLVGWTIELKNASDWSTLNSKWMRKTVSVRINLEGAMLVKDGKMLPQDDIKPGDRLYIVRDDYKAKIVIVK